MALEPRTFAGKSDDREYALRALASCLRGRLIKPGDEEYDELRVSQNAAYQRYPAAIVRAEDVTDVISAVNVARQQGLEVAVRSGGHSMSALSTVDDGLLIDLAGMKNMSVDTERAVARVETGLTFGEVADKLQEYGVAIPAGDTHSVGVGGLTLGGGIGWLVRKYGLTIDSLISADVVTADGQLITASEQENPDLFWALRGGGGNFGIVTAFEFRTHPVGMIVGGAIIYDGEDAADVLPKYAKYAAEVPDELSTITFMMAAPPLPFIAPEKHGKPIILITLAYTGDLDEGQRVVQPLRELATPIADMSGPMPYAAMYQLTAEGTARGMRHSVRSMYHDEMDGEVLAATVKNVSTLTVPGRIVQLRILGGAMARVDEEATAFAHRDARIVYTLIGVAPDAALAELQEAWVEAYWQEIAPYANGVYVNFLGDEGEARVREAYSPGHYERLVAVKNRYDPTNFFHRNQNIVPTR